MAVEPRRFRFLLTGLLLLALVGVAGALRFNCLADQPLWWDEFWTIDYSQTPYNSMWSRVGLRDKHPPLYYAMMRFWLYGVPLLGLPPVAGADDEATLRTPSALLGMLTVPVVYALGRTLGGTSQVGFLSALLFVLSPFQVRYAQEARMYTLLSFGAALSLACMAALMKQHALSVKPRLLR